MGVVYKAEDTKLERTVALKFLAAHLLNDQEAKQRFLREAKSAAALHHPNICTVYEIDEAEGKTFLAMAFLKGETLEERISKGPLPLKDALDVGRQIAEGLAAAHAERIIHRDIKPANILVSPEGRATIMDFGLARLTEASKLTRQDQTVGTAAYMSPEQIQGGEVDQRTDIWALGCVLYEMVVGLRPFKGQYDQALAYEICNQAPEPLTGLRAGVPIELEFIVGKCLAKEVGDRYDGAAELTKDLRKLGEDLKSGRSTITRMPSPSADVPDMAPGAETVNSAEKSPHASATIAKSKLRTIQALAAVAPITAIALAYLFFAQEQPRLPLLRFSFPVEGIENSTSGGSISPDGNYIVYPIGTGTASSLWLRSLRDESSRELPGTASAVGGFWSPDSSSIGFAVGFPNYEVRRISIDGGSPIMLCNLAPGSGGTQFLGGTWSSDGERIVFASRGRVYEVSARGGQTQLLLEDMQGVPERPYFLPGQGDRGAIAYHKQGVDGTRIWVLNLETNENRELGPGSDAIYSHEGFLIHGPRNANDGGLWAWPFSLDTLTPTGNAFPISTVGRMAGVSQRGTLAYLDDSGGDVNRSLVWRDRAGAVVGAVGQPQRGLGSPAISPDGRRIAVQSTESGSPDIWLHDLDRSIKTRLTFQPGGEGRPVWSPSGREIVHNASAGLVRRSADGTGEAVVVVHRGTNPDWSPDGRYLVYQEDNAETATDIRYIDLGGEGSSLESVTVVGTPAIERVARLSPDGRFLAYISNESGDFNIYVRPFPEGSGKWQVSLNGGTQPRWRRDGGELYYVERTTLMAVSVSTDQGFSVGQPQALFESPDLLYTPSAPNYEVSPDGHRFLTVTAVEDEGAAAPTIRVVQNWYEEFRGRE
jgi:serine/threonine protein kinase